MNDLSPVERPSGLTQEEAEFVWNVEVLGLPVRKAASMAGLPPGNVSKPHLMQARELLKREMRASMQLTKEDVVYGVREAIDRARLLADPETEIKGWAQISKMLGYDAPQKVEHNITASIEVLKGHVRSMSDAALAQLVNASDVIDADFYEVGGDGK
jgi:hypothetical protein